MSAAWNLQFMPSCWIPRLSKSRSKSRRVRGDGVNAMFLKVDKSFLWAFVTHSNQSSSQQLPFSRLFFSGQFIKAFHAATHRFPISTHQYILRRATCVYWLRASMEIMGHNISVCAVEADKICSCARLSSSNEGTHPPEPPPLLFYPSLSFFFAQHFFLFISVFSSFPLCCVLPSCNFLWPLWKKFTSRLHFCFMRSAWSS